MQNIKRKIKLLVDPPELERGFLWLLCFLVGPYVSVTFGSFFVVSGFSASVLGFCPRCGCSLPVLRASLMPLILGTHFQVRPIIDHVRGAL